MQYDRKIGGIAAEVAVLGFLAVLSVILRFVARARTKAGYGIDDYLAVVSLLFLFIYMAMLIYLTENGASYDVETLPLPVLQKYLKGAYATELIAASPITAAKFSILFLYRRVFNANREFRISVLIVEILCAAWWLAATLTFAFQCTPAHKAIDPLLPGHCINLQDFVVGIEVPNSILDFIIIALPLRQVSNLQLPMRHKLGLSFVFGLGGFVGIIGFIRIGITYHPHSVAYGNIGNWLLAQLACATICASLPTYRPLLPKSAWWSRFRSFYASKMGTSAKDASSATTSRKTDQSESKSRDRDKYFRTTSNDDGNDKAVLTEAVGGVADENKLDDGRDLPMHTINVRHSVEIV